MPSKPKTVTEYLDSLPEDRREMVDALRKVILKNIDKKFEEGIQYGMLGYYLPHSVYPAGYHCNPKEPLPFAGIGSQKGHLGLYLFCVYTDEETHGWFVEAWKATGRKLDMGKSCVRVKKMEDMPLDVIGKLFKRIKAKDFVAAYEEMLVAPRKAGPPKKKAAKKAKKKTKKPAAKKAARRKAKKK